MIKKVIDLSRFRLAGYILLLAVAATVSHGCTRKEELPRFAVISDLHAGLKQTELSSAQRITRTLKCLAGKDPVDALFIVGDITNNGEENEYDEIVSIFDNHENIPSGVKVYYLMGNHDNHCGEIAADRFREKLKQPLHQYIILKGYPFITLSLTGSGGYDYNGDALKFLSEKLAEAVRNFPGKPIFIFEHVPPLNTCYGSTPWGQEVLTPILSKYPQAIVFTGHTHAPVGDPRSIHQNKFTAINDGNVSYCELEPGDGLSIGTIAEHSDRVNEGLIVNVLSGGDVEIERWNTSHDEEILPVWRIKVPHDGTNFTFKKQHPMPQFADGAEAEIKLNDGICTVTFPQATDEDVIFQYIVEIASYANLHLESIASQRVFSQYYLNSQMPGKIAVHFSELPEGVPLYARVTAVNSFNGLSLPIRSERFVYKKNR
jgi:Icc-related predicted phosphoesterase